MKKTWKKTIVGMLLVCLIMALAVPAFAEEENTASSAVEEAVTEKVEEVEKIAEEITEEDGEYFRLTKMSDGEEEYSGDLLTMLGMEAFLLLKDDGTGVLSFDGDEEQITWTEETMTGEDGEPFPYTRDGDVITIDQEGFHIEFTLGKADPADVAPLTPAPFDPNTRAGYYKLSTMESDGEVMNAAMLEMLGMEMFLVLNEDNTGKLAMFGMGFDMTWDDDSIIANEEDSPYTYEEGTIKMESEGSIMTFVYAGTPDEAPEVETVDPADLEDMDADALDGLSDLGSLDLAG